MQQPEYIDMLRRMTAEQFKELLSNIGRECSTRDTTMNDYCDLAALFTSIGVGLHENGGCYVQLQIQHPSWDFIHLYETGEGSKSIPLEDDTDEEDGL